MTASDALIRGLLLTALLALAPVAAADDIDVCIRNGQVYTGPECSSTGTESEPATEDDPLDVCVKNGQVVVGPECSAS